MQQIRGKFGYIVGRGHGYELQSFLLSQSRSNNYTNHNRIHTVVRGGGSRRLLLVNNEQVLLRRGAAMLVARLLKGVLKVRYLLLGGAVTGGVTLNKKYEEWKDGLPDMSWISKYMPDSENVDNFRGSLISIKDKLKEMEIDPRLVGVGEEKLKNFQEWLNQRLAEAYAAAEQTEIQERSTERYKQMKDWIGEKMQQQAPSIQAAKEATVKALPFSAYKDSGQTRIDSLQQELIEVQLKYQKELEKLEKDNRELKKQILLLKNQRLTSSKTIKRSLIDMYSEVLDELSGYDSEYSTQDHLPRVVVVGDQSAGKTSVLEMIAQARIFPRGAGEMMTRAPVKVTLSEGPYHIAQFKDSEREFDLTKEEDLAALRTEIELRMKKSVRGGKTVSNEVISMTVKGPGLQRMVLVDLPGIISTVTQDMAEDTRECIKRMTQAHVSNPNAIILCIQDGSVDAERSNVTDLVASVDPHGRRTIFVLTKVDLAEQNMANPERIKKILSGMLFPMKALGYFAVVTGRGKKDESIQQIKEYEEDFFRNSKLFRSSLMSQVTTKNLSLAVSECFWNMVKQTVEQQADAFKATRFNLESEWKNTFPRTRELDRDELFEKARGEILDEVINLSQKSAKDWEDLLQSELWNRVGEHLFSKVYYPSAQSATATQCATLADIRLREWVDGGLPEMAVMAGSAALTKAFAALLAKSNETSDKLFHSLKQAVMEEALARHSWEPKGNEMLRMIQLNALEDMCIHDKQQWDDAVTFWDSCLKERLQGTEKSMKEMLGPSTKERWLYWQYTSEDQSRRKQIKSQLDKLLTWDEEHRGALSRDELTSVRSQLEVEGIKVSDELIQDTWQYVYLRHFLKKTAANASFCRKQYYLYHQQEHISLDSLECNDVVLFWRVQQMLGATSRALRQQVMNREARRLDKIIKEVLEDFSQDQEMKTKLLTGKRVTLAEDLKRVRQIQDKLEEFIQALNKEK